MAFLTPHPSEKNRKRWRVCYTVTVGGKKIRRDKYDKIKADAELMMSRLIALERATKQGYASEQSIQTWIDHGWITEPEALEAFTDYGELLERKKETRAEQTDLEKIFKTIEEKSARNSKGGPQDKTHTSRMSYMRRIKRWLEHTSPDLSDLTPSMINKWKDELSNQQAQNTVRHILVNLKGFLDEAVSLGMLTANPSHYVSPPRPKVDTPRRILDLKEIERVKKLSYNHRSILYGSLPSAVMLGLYAGMRAREISWLPWNAIEWDIRIITIQKTLCPATGTEWVPKSYEMRRIDVKEELIEFLRAERERQRQEKLLQTFIVPNRRADKPVSKDALQKAFRKMVDREPELVDTITLHVLRHSYATWALRSGVDIETVRKRMGHADLTTTMEYLHYVEPEKHPMDNLPY